MRKHLPLAVALVSCAATAFAQTIDLGRNHKSVKPSRHGLAAIQFDLDAGALSRGEGDLVLPMPGDAAAPLRMKRERFEAREGSDGFWHGTVELRDDSEVMLTLRDGFMAGTIRLGGEVYEVRPTAEGHVVERIDPSSFPACAGAAEVPAPSEEIAGLEPAALDRGGFSFSTGGAGQRDALAVSIIDLLSVYTPQARAAVGGTGQIVALIQAAVDAANQAFANSRVNAVYRLVKTAEVAHDDAGNLSTDLGWVRSDATVASLRNQSGADMVSLVVENGAGYCGMGYAMAPVSANFAAYAFQVTARNCALGNMTLAHEHGHNLGMQHDAANGPAPASAAFPWAYGYLVNGVFRTVMSYSTECPNGCARVPYFSNPDVSYQGYPTGVANSSDNARVANATAALVAGFRSLTAPTGPVAPSGLTATAASPSQINLTWVDASSDETGFRVEGSRDGVSFSAVVTMGAGRTAYSVTGLSASTLYTFRVRAYNTVGESANSNLASATTQGLPVPSAPTGLSASVAGDTQINLSWTDTASNEDGFKLERSAGGGAFVQIANLLSGVTTYANSGLTPGTAYTYRVRAYNAGGDSGFSNTGTASTTAPSGPALAPPAGFRGTPLYAGSTLVAARLAWTDGQGETSYRVERCKAASLTATCSFATLRSLTANSTSLVDTGVYGAKGIYKYRIRSENGNASSDWSETTVNMQ